MYGSKILILTCQFVKDLISYFRFKMSSRKAQVKVNKEDVSRSVLLTVFELYCHQRFENTYNLSGPHPSEIYQCFGSSLGSVILCQRPLPCVRRDKNFEGTIKFNVRSNRGYCVRNHKVRISGNVHDKVGDETGALRKEMRSNF